MSKSSYRPPNLNRQPSGPVGSALVLAGLILLAIPLTQLLSDLETEDTMIELMDVSLPPPDMLPPEPPEPPEEEEEEEKPEFEEEAEPLDLRQLDVQMNPGVGNALGIGQTVTAFGVTPDSISQMRIFELRDLDNDPRRIFAARPVYPFQFKREGIEGWVRLIIIVDEKGNVIEAKLQRSSHKEFVKPALDAILQWKFEPGTKNGRPVRVRRIQPISFKLN